MKNFRRNNQQISLCGLNCCLCPMNLGGYCPGCGGGEGNQSCAIARCSIEHDHLQYCSDCNDFPCFKYDRITEYDSFITHKNQIKDLLKLKQIGVERYKQEQVEKRRILDYFLAHFNNGRKKNFFCIAVNLLELEDLEPIIAYVKSDRDFRAFDKKEQIIQVSKMIQEIADSRGIVLKLVKKKQTK